MCIWAEAMRATLKDLEEPHIQSVHDLGWEKDSEGTSSLCKESFHKQTSPFKTDCHSLNCISL